MKYLLLLALMACQPYGPAMTPEERGIEVVPEDELYKLYNQNKALYTTQWLIEDYYGEDFRDLAIDGVKVYYTATPCPYDDGLAVIYKGRCYYGRMWDCMEMYVALNPVNATDEHPYGITSDTALLHEFGHCLYTQMDPFHTGCPDHSDDEFWDLISQARKRTKEEGW